MKIQNFFSGPGNNGAKNIFISYRVRDTAGEAGRLHDALKERFDENRIFRDIEKIEPGLDFSQVISRSLDSCDIMLAIIGPNWLGASSSNSSPRIQDPQDWVRQEISTAIKRNIRVIPVLVDGATMPLAEQLPEDLRPLLMRQAYEVSNSRWEYDTDRLINFLEKSVGIPAKNARIQRPQNTTVQFPPYHEKSWLRRNLVWMLVVSALVAFIWLLLIGITTLTEEAGQALVYDNNSNNPSYIDPSNAPESGVNPVPTKEEQPVQVHGTWVDDAGLRFVFNQKENSFTLNIYGLDGVAYGSGSGVMNNGEISFDANYQIPYEGTSLNIKFTYQGTLSADGKQMDGVFTPELTGVPERYILQR